MGRADIEASQPGAPSSPTRELAAWAVSAKPGSIGATAHAWAEDAILDWFGVTLAGSREPLSLMLAEAAREEGDGPARLVGLADSLSPLNAALVNGAASHALDYDDVNSRMMGHPTVPLVPVLLAIADTRKVSGPDFLDAFVVGYETEVLAAEMVGLSHYDRGWHMTATIGTLGAAAAAARLLGLDAERAAHALGLAVAQAAGLKSMFGTMSKPFQVGKSASNGLLAARLAGKGMTSRTDALECAQGLADTQSDGFTPQEISPGGNSAYAVEGNLFKYHAACYLTHSSIEAARQLRLERGVAPEAIERLTIEVNKGALSVCNIERPETGLQVKFSLRHTVAMALSGRDTADLNAYTDDLAQDEALRELGRRSMVVGVEADTRTVGRVRAELKDGTVVEEIRDVGVPAADQPAQRQRLLEKYRTLGEPVLGAARTVELADRIFALAEIEDASVLSALAQPD
ncbi:MmgE/PrpD family protein [Nisaea acidiphila]|uniref:MmgE/PrpD family protein n=1 Tax=Nisaea acidiphila TaxID=1862145 RepID=A0A9J7ASJ1_9PROT|nr:MmgE/PrpD family protein [Nisaea acidiphila]UUX50312.1 MmgE/PrpD family protein [Nisaea acidiphila]